MVVVSLRCHLCDDVFEKETVQFISLDGRLKQVCDGCRRRDQRKPPDEFEEIANW